MIHTAHDQELVSPAAGATLGVELSRRYAMIDIFAKGHSEVRPEGQTKVGRMPGGLLWCGECATSLLERRCRMGAGKCGERS